MIKLLLLLATVPALAQALPTPGAHVDVYDGFETPALSNLWETSRFTPGAIEMQSAIVRAGHGAVRITVHSRDTFEAGQNGDADSERDELLEARALTAREATPYEFSWSMYFPPDFPIVPVRLVVAQWKQYCRSDTNPVCSDDSPVLAVRYIGGVLRITQDLAHKLTVLYEVKTDLRSRWLDLRFRVRFTPSTDGRIQAFLDGKQVVDFHGVTANAEDTATGYTSPGYYFFKMGLYRNVMSQPMTIYLDEYRKRQLAADEF